VVIELSLIELRLDKLQERLAIESFERLRNDWSVAGLMEQPAGAQIVDNRASMRVSVADDVPDQTGSARNALIQAMAHVQVAHQVYWPAQDEPGKADPLDMYLAITLSQIAVQVIPDVANGDA